MPKLIDLVVGAALAIAVVMSGAWGLPKVDPKDEAAARRVYDQVQSGDFAGLQAWSGPAMKGPDAKAQLDRLRAILPAGPPRSVKTVGWRYFTVIGVERTLQITQEYDYGDRTALVSSNFSRPSVAAAWTVVGVHAQVATARELAVNNFTLQGKSLAQYAFLATTILSPLLMLGALVKVIRTDGLKRKWLWGILAFFGLFLFRMDWTTGQIAPLWTTIQLIGSGVVREGSRFSPWMMSFTFPIGALLILSGVWGNPKRSKTNALRTAPAGS